MGEHSGHLGKPMSRIRGLRLPSPIFPRVVRTSSHRNLMTPATAIALCALIVGAPRSTIPQVAVRNVPSDPSCAACRIDVKEVARLGTQDGPGSIPDLPHAVRSDQAGRYWVFAGATAPLLYDGNGEFLRVIGTTGAGPGEFRLPRDLVPLPGDSLYIIDSELRRATIFTPSLRPFRTVQLPAALFPSVVLRWPSQVIMNGAFSTPTSAGWPLHQLSLAGASADVVASFGPDHGDVSPGMARTLSQVLSGSRDGRFWAADAYRYRITQWDRDLRKIEVLERKPEWFAGPSRPSIGNPKAPPPPSIVAIQEDSTGLVWVFARIAAEAWREGWAKVDPNAHEIPGNQIAMEKLFRTAVEVIDPRAGRVVASRVVDAWIIGALPHSRAAACQLDSLGVPHVSVLSLSLARAQ